MFLDALFDKPQPTGMRYATTPDSYSPVFSQNGRSVYSYDIVQTCIDCKATELSKLQPRHIRRDSMGRLLPLAGDSINRLLRYKPNPYMITREFIEKIIWNYELNYNSFVYPMYEIATDARGFASRYYTALYPISPCQVDFLQDPAGDIFVKLYFRSGVNFTIPYSDIIHIRKKFSVNDIMGGGTNGQPDNTSFSKTLTVYESLIQGVAQALNISMNIRGILKLKTAMETPKQTAERHALEKQLSENKSGIISGDYTGDFEPVTIDPKIIDAETLAFIENKILRWTGVSLPILNGDYTDSQYEAFYNKSLLPPITGLGQAFSSIMFTPTEQSFNNEIVFYPQDLNYLTMSSRLNIVDKYGSQGLLTDDQKLGIIGFPPLADGTGNRRTQSLNFADVQIVSNYQLGRARIEGSQPDNNQTTQSAE